MKDPIKAFEKETQERLNENGKNSKLIKAAEDFMVQSTIPKYSYNFTWMGRPIIQYPQDMIAMQEIIWKVKPDLVIDIGIAHGGSLIYYASLLELIGNGHVLGVDIDIREHNKQAIMDHQMSNRITMFEGSSIDSSMIDKVHKFSKKYKNILVSLDSNHTHEHVLAELNAYSDLVSKNSYLVVFDTIVENLPEGSYTDRPWGKGNNPMTAMKEFIKQNTNFAIDKSIDNKLLISVAPSGYLKRVI
jgi:cephalosporin hydroxylase